MGIFQEKPGCIRHLSGPRQTHSTSSKKLHVNRTKGTYGDRSFSVGAARLWNELPQHFMSLEDNESVKRELKTWLFRKAYGK
jgi:hypothetical protein